MELISWLPKTHHESTSELPAEEETAFSDATWNLSASSSVAFDSPNESPGRTVNAPTFDDIPLFGIFQSCDAANSQGEDKMRFITDGMIGPLPEMPPASTPQATCMDLRLTDLALNSTASQAYSQQPHLKEQSFLPNETQFIDPMLIAQHFPAPTSASVTSDSAEPQTSNNSVMGNTDTLAKRRYDRQDSHTGSCVTDKLSPTTSSPPSSKQQSSRKGTLKRDSLPVFTSDELAALDRWRSVRNGIEISDDIRYLNALNAITGRVSANAVLVNEQGVIGDKAEESEEDWLARLGSAHQQREFEWAYKPSWLRCLRTED